MQNGDANMAFSTGVITNLILPRMARMNSSNETLPLLSLSKIPKSVLMSCVGIWVVHVGWERGWWEKRLEVESNATNLFTQCVFATQSHVFQTIMNFFISKCATAIIVHDAKQSP